jgi:hypothetical protein
MYINTMNNANETEALYDLDGNCICKLEQCAFCNPDLCDLCDGEAHHIEECPKHACTGDNCYCIGGDENLDNAMRGC